MINRKTLASLAAVTFVLMVISAIIGENRDVLWIVDDIVWYSLLICGLTLIVLTVTALARAVAGSRRRQLQ